MTCCNYLLMDFQKMCICGVIFPPFFQKNLIFHSQLVFLLNLENQETNICSNDESCLWLSCTEFLCGGRGPLMTSTSTQSSFLYCDAFEFSWHHWQSLCFHREEYQSSHLWEVMSDGDHLECRRRRRRLDSSHWVWMKLRPDCCIDINTDYSDWVILMIFDYLGPTVSGQ